ncbi:helix-turn-helix transcriptional regulator [Rhizobium sp. S-51]|jgi:DNA-binding HxlR family transcriptional regulator|uniref:Helix-turn-helix transcriptional regulator n=1 Tax=Rhizobium terricola TaxID=2728849 RepID=A0A7Y0B0G6_9HYPH|nr:helix-turn-helix domain-containing protein [Rhizobium terricola]NML76819.1 helix-turn-helix transcriptional regulator [Rhizobium terricola]
MGLASETYLQGACEAECPVRRAAEVLEGKWTTLIVRELVSGVKRYSELQRALAGISPKILADRLALLQVKGLVVKTIYPCVPPKTEYELTPLGREMEKVIRAMAEFGLMLQAAGEATSARP